VELCKQFSLLIHYGNSALNHFQQVPPPTNWFWPRPWTRQMMDCRPGTQLTPLPLSSPVRATIKCQVYWLILMPGWEPVPSRGESRQHLPDDHSVVKPTLSPWKFNFPRQLPSTVANAYEIRNLLYHRVHIEEIILDGYVRHSESGKLSRFACINKDHQCGVANS